MHLPAALRMKREVKPSYPREGRGTANFNNPLNMNHFNPLTNRGGGIPFCLMPAPIGYHNVTLPLPLPLPLPLRTGTASPDIDVGDVGESSSYGPQRNHQQRPRFNPIQQQQQQQLRRSPASPTNIYVSQFPSNWGKIQLQQVFAKFGPIDAIRVLTKQGAGRNRGVGFVHFKLAESASQAVEEMDQIRPHGATTPLVVKPANLNKRQGQTAHSGMRLNLTRTKLNGSYQLESTTNVYISEFPTHWDEKKLRLLFDKFGGYSRLSVLTNKRERRENRGVGFIHYLTAESACKAVAHMDQTKPEDAMRPISVKFANIPKGMQPEGLSVDELTDMESVVNVYVRHFPNEWKEDDLREVFEHFGTIAEIKILTSTKFMQRNHGVGFVHFEEPTAAVKSVAFVNDSKPKDAMMPLSVSFAKVHQSSLLKLQSEMFPSQPAALQMQKTPRSFVF